MSNVFREIYEILSGRAMRGDVGRADDDSARAAGARFARGNIPLHEADSNIDVTRLEQERVANNRITFPAD